MIPDSSEHKCRTQNISKNNKYNDEKNPILFSGASESWTIKKRSKVISSLLIFLDNNVLHIEIFINIQYL